MKKAGDEMSHFDAYDYIIVNDNIGIAFEAVKSILRAEQLKRERQVGLSGFVRELQRQLENYPSPFVKLAFGATAAHKIPQSCRPRHPPHRGCGKDQGAVRVPPLAGKANASWRRYLRFPRSRLDARGRWPQSDAVGGRI